MGSLDHVLTNSAALRQVTGADVWNINSVESVAFEYSRYNYNVTDFYAPNQFRASDHDPLVVGFDVPAANKRPARSTCWTSTTSTAASMPTRSAGPPPSRSSARTPGDDSVSTLISAGDNIGASLFASASAKDQPTIDVLNALGLRRSAVGNHEFDKGWADLTGRVADRLANWDYLGANVYAKGTGTRAPGPVQHRHGQRRQGRRHRRRHPGGPVPGHALGHRRPGVQGPGRRGQQGRRRADRRHRHRPTVRPTSIIAEYHEGAPEGASDGATLEKELAARPGVQAHR